MNLFRRIMRRLGLLTAEDIRGFSSRLELLEEKVRFLITEDIRLNQLLRELIYHNDLKRADTGTQTKDSFDYQWRQVNAGKWLASDPEFIREAENMMLKMTQLPREWFPGKRVLDAGCGSGRWTYALAKLGANVTAIDQSRGGLEQARTLVGGIGCVEFRQADLLNLQIESESFDLVWCFGVAHHTENPLKVLKNITAAVVPDGHLFVMLYGFPEDIIYFREKASYEEWRRKLSPLSNEDKVRVLREHYPEELVHGYFDAVSPHINELFTFEWIQTFLQNEGFDSVRRTWDNANHYVVAHKVPK